MIDLRAPGVEPRPASGAIAVQLAEATVAISLGLALAILPSSQAALRLPGPLRTGHESFLFIRLKPFERLFQGDAVSRREDAGGVPGHGILDEVKHGCRHVSNHPSPGRRNDEDASR